MNGRERVLLTFVAEGNLRRAQEQAKLLVAGITSQKEQAFCKQVNEKLDKQLGKKFEIPYNLEGILMAKDSETFPVDRFYVREDDAKVAEKVLVAYKAALKLEEMGIKYLPSAIFYGESGCGKTMLAQYIAYRAGLPFVYIKFSSLFDSLLGATQKNLGRIFQFVSQTPCVLCFDEVDAVGGARGAQGEVGEISRITISMMQELDNIGNQSIIIGTSNRMDIIDAALARRFNIKHEVRALSSDDASRMAAQFFTATGIGMEETEIKSWFHETFQTEEPTANTVVKACTDVIINRVVNDMMRM